MVNKLFMRDPRRRILEKKQNQKAKSILSLIQAPKKVTHALKYTYIHIEAKREKSNKRSEKKKTH